MYKWSSHFSTREKIFIFIFIILFIFFIIIILFIFIIFIIILYYLYLLYYLLFIIYLYYLLFHLHTHHNILIFFSYIYCNKDRNGKDSYGIILKLTSLQHKRTLGLLIAHMYL